LGRFLKYFSESRIIKAKGCDSAPGLTTSPPTES